MGKSLYKEALIEAKELKAAAEHNAKLAVMEAITPKIRKLVEKSLSGDDDEEDDEDDILLDLAPEEAGSRMPNAEGKTSLDLSKMRSESRADDRTEDENPNAPDAKISDPDEDDTEGDRDLRLDHDASLALERLTKMNKSVLHDEIVEAIESLEEEIVDGIDPKNVQRHRESLERAYAVLQESSVGDVKKRRLNKRLESLYEALTELMKEQSEESGDMLNEETLTLTIDGLPDGVTAMADVGGAEEDDGLGDDLGDELSQDEEGGEPGGDDLGDLGAGGEEEDDLDLESVLETDEDDMGMGEGLESLSDDTVLEISDVELKNELARMRMLRRDDLSERVDGGEFGGGSKCHELFVDGEELNKSAGKTPGMQEARREVKKLRAENRRLAAEYNKLLEAAKGLRAKLVEQNLFNAKLLFTNKLLQSEDLNSRQKLAIAERLDEAKSLREAKLIYNSLTDTLAAKKSPLAESGQREAKRVLGSSSRPTRSSSAGNVNESAELQRWSKLAGLDR